MVLKFGCQNCGKDIFVKFLKIGEIAKCKSCGSENIVPEAAVETVEEQNYINTLRKSLFKNGDDPKLKEEETQQNIQKSQFTFVPTIIDIIGCVLLTLGAALPRVKVVPDDPIATIADLSAVAIFTYIVWARALRLFPWSIKKIIVENNKIVFQRRNGKNKEVIEPIGYVTLFKREIMVNGYNNKGKRVERDIRQKSLKSDDYEQIKTILKDKIDLHQSVKIQDKN